jgi:pyrroline-5-carboxylate reductase
MSQAERLQGAQLSFIGCGVMAEAIIAGLINNHLVKPEQIVGSHPRSERREELERKYGIRLVENNAEAVTLAQTPVKTLASETSSSIIFLTVKPQRLG